ncbi:MAG: DinB family protein [Chloroflexi bacterium]|jgi:predicted RNase H-like nuclease (RuvC/YqgF family)|nr:DinB family protein [Chloroflexota bacterium]
MKELMEYRVKIVERLGEAAREFRAACEAIQDPFTKVEGEWTLHQIASHTRDVDKIIYGARIHQTLNEDNPEFKNFDADSWMANHYNREESLAEILDEFSKNMEELRKILSAMPREAWSRESRHETMGGELPLQLWVERSLAHIEEHLRTLKNA